MVEPEHIIGPAVQSSTPAGMRVVYRAGDVIYCWYVPAPSISPHFLLSSHSTPDIRATLTSDHQPACYRPLAIRLPIPPAMLARETHVCHRLDPRTIPNLPVLHITPQLDDHARALVPGALHAELPHRGHGEVFEHVVQVGVAYSRCIEAEEEVVGAC